MVRINRVSIYYPKSKKKIGNVLKLLKNHRNLKYPILIDINRISDDYKKLLIYLEDEYIQL